MKLTVQQTSLIALVCLVLIFTSQAWLVYDLFQTTKAGLIRESDEILRTSFRTDITRREKLYLKKSGVKRITIPPISDEKRKKIDQNNITGIVDLEINEFFSHFVPFNLRQFDSIIDSNLQARGIQSEFMTRLIDRKTSKIADQSKNKSSIPLLTIPSKKLIIDIDQNYSIQLILINPFGLMLKSMGLILFSSLVLCIICLLAFGNLMKVWKRQKRLVLFKNDFLGTIAHELKRPVTSLTFNLDCLTMPDIIDNRRQHEIFVDKSIHATLELSDTINMIVALARVEEGLLQLNKQPIDLKQLFEDLKTRFQHSTGKQVEIKTQYELPENTCTGDPLLLTQCFANLLDNAIKYSGNEVIIVVSIRKSDSWVVVSIRDNGFGIPEEKLPEIFEKYTRANTEHAKIGGFGIGLNYVKTIVEKHEGEVNVQSQPGIGSEFSVLLPE